MESKRPRPLTIFFAIAFAYTWAVELCMILMHLRIEFSILATLGPTIAALVAQRTTSGDFRAFQFSVKLGATLTACAAGIALTMTAFDILPALAVSDARSLHWGALISFGVYNYSTLLGGPLFEEPGWRGFALPRLQARFGPLPATLFLGTVWTAWHLPLFWYPGLMGPIGLYFPTVLALSVILTFTANLGRFGVIDPILVHALFNTKQRHIPELLRDTTPGAGGFLMYAAQHWHRNLSISFGAVIAIAAWIVAGALIAFTRGRLGARPANS